MSRRRSQNDAGNTSAALKAALKGLSVVPAVWREEKLFLSRQQLSHAQSFLQDVTYAVFEKPYVSAIFCTSSLSSANTRSWTFVTLFYAVANLRKPGRGSSKIAL